MIFDTLENIDTYKGINSRIESVLREALKIKAEDYPSGRLEIEGQNAFINFAQYDTHPKEESLFEAHRNYVDVMIMVEGEEYIYVKNINKLNHIEKEYDPKIDALLTPIEDDSTEIHMTPGTFLVLFPEDVHGPGCSVNQQIHVKKMIGKVFLGK